MIWFLLACGPSSTPDAAAPSAVQQQLLARPLELTRHGACRMDCRSIDRNEVVDVLRSGTLKPERTRNDGRCPSYAIEGRGTDGHRLRIVYAGCADQTRVVTAIDLDQEHRCSCP